MHCIRRGGVRLTVLGGGGIHTIRSSSAVNLWTDTNDHWLSFTLKKSVFRECDHSLNCSAVKHSMISHWIP